MGIQLNQVIPWGRSFDEYRRMFELSPQDLGGRILGCADGPSSFNAEATAHGCRVVSRDPIYKFDASQIEARIRECYDDLMTQVRQDPSGFVWTDFRDPEHLGHSRLEAMRRFLADFQRPQTGGRYVAASLPKLPFASKSFDMALVSHLLFLYSDRLDLNFHWASVVELLRIAREIRIFPLLTLAQQQSRHVKPLLERCNRAAWKAGIRQVPYEFQRRGNEMLKISR